MKDGQPGNYGAKHRNVRSARLKQEGQVILIGLEIFEGGSRNVGSDKTGVKHEERLQLHFADCKSPTQEIEVPFIIASTKFDHKLTVRRIATVEIPIFGSGFDPEMLPAARSIGSAGEAHVGIDVGDQVRHA